MTGDAGAARPVPARDAVRRPGRSVRRFIPPQHGAWAMLLVPYLAGLIVTGWRWPHLPLLVAWLAGYLLSFYALQAVKTRRVQRVRGQLLVYAAVAAAAITVVIAARPGVLAVAPAYALLTAVNAYYAWRRRERALVNDLASVVQSCLMVFLVAAVAGSAPTTVLGVFAVVLAYFTGTVLYVKTMIRERGNPAYRRWSIAYHWAAFGACAWLVPPVAVAFALLLARAWILPGRPVTPKHVGIIEIVFCALLLAAIAVAWG
jgi:hypothetical protein